MDNPQEEIKKPRLKRKVKPTLKQIKAVQYVNQGYSVRKAMRLAGYSQNTANLSTGRFNKLQGVQNLIFGMVGKMEKHGINVDVMAAKMAEWINAEKVDHSPTEPDKFVPDYETQLKAYDRWKKVMDEVAHPDTNGKVKRKLTIEEFITDQEQQP